MARLISGLKIWIPLAIMVFVGSVTGIHAAESLTSPVPAMDTSRELIQPLPIKPIPPPTTYQLLIITPQELIWPAYFLAEHKRGTGISTLLKKISDIENDPAYAAGRDVQEKIKLAINALHNQYRIGYVLLFGDSDQFPVRWMWQNDQKQYGLGRRYQPSDLYFADLIDPLDLNFINDLDNSRFSNWDYTGDGRFGEMYLPETEADSWMDLNHDRIDLVPDVAVGRIPASNATEAYNMMAKIVDYELDSAGQSWTKRMMVVTGNWGNPNAVADAIADTMTDAGYAITKHYFDPADPNWGNPANDPARQRLLRNEFASGYGMVSYLGHGAPNGWNNWYSSADVATVANSTRLPVVFAAACDTARFHVTDRHYTTVAGDEYNCTDANLIHEDATFKVVPLPWMPALTQLMTINTSPRRSVGPDDTGNLETQENGNAFYVRTSPVHDPRPYWRSFRSFNYPDRSIRHQYFQGRLTDIASTLDQKDATFRPVPGLAESGDPTDTVISLESWNLPGWFLVEKNGSLVLRQHRICDRDYEMRATFYLDDGRADPDAWSLESFKYPGRFVRHRNFQLYVESGSGTLFDQDATFYAIDSHYDPTPDYGSYYQLGTSAYITHRGANGLQLILGTADNATAQTRATFRIMAPLKKETSGGVSLEAIVPKGSSDDVLLSRPNWFVRHYWDRLYLAKHIPLPWTDQPEPAAIQEDTMDVDSMAEAFLVQSANGAIAYIGAFTGAQGAAIDMNQIFFEEMASRPGELLGDVWKATMTRYVQEKLNFEWGGWGPGATYDHVHKMILFGDPTLRIGGIQ